MSTLQAQLEALLDKQTLPAVLDDLIQICNDKAEHVRSAWQDETLAEAWDLYAKHLSVTLDLISTMEVKP